MCSVLFLLLKSFQNIPFQMSIFMIFLSSEFLKIFNNTHVSFDAVRSMRYKVIVILHVSSFFHSNKMLHGIQTFSVASACKELLDGHPISQEHRYELLTKRKRIRSIDCFCSKIKRQSIRVCIKIAKIRQKFTIQCQT